MKKIVTGILALACAASMFAADFNARVYMTGTLAGNDGDDTYIFKLNQQDQKDDDALKVSVNGDKAGAQFQFFYNYKGDESETIKVRSTSLWFKPIDQIKIKVGNLSTGTYKEMVHWWKDPAGASYAAAGSWDGGYSGFATVEAAGAEIEVTPVSGLWLTAGVAPGAGNQFAKFVKDNSDANTNSAYGAAVKYDFNGVAGIPMTAAVAWRDAGKGANKILAIGADYGNNWGEGFYGFLNARLFFSNHLAAYAGDAGDGVVLTGITLDNYLKFSAGSFKVIGRFPVVIRGLHEFKDAAGNKQSDPSYMFWSAKVTYAIDAFTPYLLMGSDVVNAHDGYVFGDETKDGKANTFAGSFNIDIQPGVTFNVGTCALDCGVLISVGNPDANDERKVNWSVPVTFSVGF